MATVYRTTGDRPWSLVTGVSPSNPNPNWPSRTTFTLPVGSATKIRVACQGAGGTEAFMGMVEVEGTFYATSASPTGPGTWSMNPAPGGGWTFAVDTDAPFSSAVSIKGVRSAHSSPWASSIPSSSRDFFNNGRSQWIVFSNNLGTALFDFNFSQHTFAIVGPSSSASSSGSSSGSSTGSSAASPAAVIGVVAAVAVAVVGVAFFVTRAVRRRSAIEPQAGVDWEAEVPAGLEEGVVRINQAFTEDAEVVSASS